MSTLKGPQGWDGLNPDIYEMALTGDLRELRRQNQDGLYMVQGTPMAGPHIIAGLLDRLEDSHAVALSEAQAGEGSAEEVQRLRSALMEIRRYPKGWENRGSIQDFIDEVVPRDARR